MYLYPPYSEDLIKPYCGRPVCVVMADGSCQYGVLGGLQGNQLILDGCYESAGLAHTRRTGNKNKLAIKSKKTGRAKAKIKQYPYGSFGGGRRFINLAAISLLFLLPLAFFW